MKIQFIALISIFFICSCRHDDKVILQTGSGDPEFSISDGLFDSVIHSIRTGIPDLIQNPTVNNKNYSDGVKRSTGFEFGKNPAASISIKEFISDEKAIEYKNTCINNIYHADPAGNKLHNIRLSDQPGDASEILVISHLILIITPGKMPFDIDPAEMIRNQFPNYTTEIIDLRLKQPFTR